MSKPVVDIASPSPARSADGTGPTAPSSPLLEAALSCLSTATRTALDNARDLGLPTDYALELVLSTLAEDLSWGPDVTTNATLGTGARGTAAINSRQSGCLAGVPLAAAAFEVLPIIVDAPNPAQPGGSSGESTACQVDIEAADGSTVRPGTTVLTVSGPLHIILTAERTALNILSQLSGVATATDAWVKALRGTSARVRDTRKTQPGLRIAQKYAVRCGGGVNHRMGLGDAALIKDNHVAAVGSIGAAVRAVREKAPHIPIEVECDTLEQVREAVTAGVPLILLDNMSPETARAAVDVARRGGVRTEASGGLSIEDAAEFAATGVDYIAVGALTHSPTVLDLGLDLA
nr:carboxylating nicotinate-nucleotide diphosphorylase [Corynebacterium heidelbergense]